MMLDGPETARLDLHDAMVLERESLPLSEKQRRAEEEARLANRPFAAEGDSDGELGPRRALRRASPPSQRVHGWVCDSPRWPQPLCEV